VLIANGICFAVMTVMFIALGSAADYGNFGRWLLLVLTVACCVFQYCMMAITRPYIMACCDGVLHHCVHCICKFALGIAPANLNTFAFTDMNAGCHSRILRCTVPEIGSIYATCKKSTRGRFERRQDQSSRI
jgi:hypothetical protein